MTDRDPFQSLWTQQAQAPFSMTTADLARRSARFQSTIRRRNITEYAAAALVIGVFGWMAWLIPVPAVKAGAVLVSLGALYVCWKLHVLAGAGVPDAAVPLADFHRTELLRQRSALASVWKWYLAPFVPGILVFIGGVAFAEDTGLPLSAGLMLFATSAGFVAAIFAAIWWLNQRAVAALDREIAALDVGSK
ncbi:MAG: hypothetical protein IPK75_05470 [Acidobacteria bacterium]|nr:hypothetical protein [Acidobacteriota bacterium]